MSTPVSFFAELKRRNVVRMAGLYLVGAWLLIQVASTVLPTFNVPVWVLRGVIAVLAIAFIPALIFSWVFELTPQGLKRDEDVRPEESIAPQTARRMDRLIIVVLALALAYFCFDKFILTPRREAAMIATASAPNDHKSAIPEKSIAVLPFENLSSDKDNAYFAEGIQDEILTRLAKIGALKVISRTSTSHYESSPQNLPQIAQQLGVANILEGSVQKAKDAVHVNVQLIRAATDNHLWAESYNRKLDDIFAVEGEVAGAIADALNAKLSGHEEEALAAKPTNKPAAYEAYLRGLAFEGRVDTLLPNTLSSIEAFGEAVRLDPNFALAWGHLSRQDSFAVNLSDQTVQRRQAAGHALEVATQLGPHLVETQLADGFYHYWVERDYARARTIFESVRKSYPNNYWAPYALGAIARREGQWDQARRLFAETLEINPEDVFLLVDASLTDISMRDAAGAQKILARAHDLNPENPAVLAFQAMSYQLTGDIAQAQTLLDHARPAEGDNNLIVMIVSNAILARSYEKAIGVLKAQLTHPEALGILLGSFENLLGDLQRHSGDTKAAMMTYERAHADLVAALVAQPHNPDLTSSLAWAETWLGDKAAALADGERAATLLPESKDAWIGPGGEDTLARIQAHFGDQESAIAALQHLLSISYGLPPVTPALLRLDPDWDNLRGDPRFEKLCQERQP
jgi:TolB-like protein/Flp pilus assembly protein TadD